jgi:hypothetical protein
LRQKTALWLPDRPLAGGVPNEDRKEILMTRKSQSEERAEANAIRQQQHTGSHDRPPGEDPDRFAGTRAGAENVEPGRKARNRAKPGNARES